MQFLKRVFFTFLSFIFLTSNIFSQVFPVVTHGRIIRLGNFNSRHIPPRHVDIWLPEGYSDSEKYAVLYMQDGQMLFDSSITWNKQSWDMDDCISDLINKEKIKRTIVVGVWNAGENRHAEYFPQKPFARLSKKQKKGLSAQLKSAGRTSALFTPYSDKYLRFLVEELKPYVDKHFSVYSDSKNTFVAGSSMGALISLYAMCEYPDVFGGAACLSTHWPGTFDTLQNPFPAAMLEYLNSSLYRLSSRKIYFDTGDKTLDQLYLSTQKKVDLLMNEKKDVSFLWVTKYFPGDDHSERSWRKRIAIPMQFLLKPD